MNVFQLFNLSFEALRARRLRAGLTTLMVVMGASLIVALNGTGNGFANFVNNQFSSLGANVLIVSPRGENIDIDTALANQIKKIEGVSDVILYIQQISTIVIQGEAQTSIIIGTEQTKLHLLFPTMSYESGTFVSDTDSVGIVLGNEVAKSSDSTQTLTSLGQTVNIKYQTYEGQKIVTVQRSFVVRGVLKYIGSGIVPADQMVFISISAAKNLFRRGSNYDGLYVVTENPDLNKAVLDQIRDRYGNDVIVFSPQQISNMIQQVTSSIYLFINVVAMVSLLVASVGIITTLQTSVMERIKEIGLLKALGFNRTVILGLFLCEAMIIGMLGGSIGVFLGMGLSHAVSILLGQTLRIDTMFGGKSQFSLQLVPAFNPVFLFQTWVLCIALSMISGFYPSWRASRLDPVVALRNE
jgi:putative ABC transport system permease protein